MSESKININELMKHVKKEAEEAVDAAEKSLNAASYFEGALLELGKTAKKAQDAAYYADYLARGVQEVVEKIETVLQATNPNVTTEIPTEIPTKTNGDIAYALLKLSLTHDDDQWSIMAYRKAAEAISNLDFQVTDGSELAKGPKKVVGIGKGIARLIDEFLNTGNMTKSKELRAALNKKT
jgi:uncharacterized protein YyaL (SSP411 family)